MATYNKAELMRYAEQTAIKYGLDPKIIIRQINQESGFNPKAKSSAGALGIAQIMPDTAKGWKVNPLDPYASIEAMCREQAKYLKTYKGDYKKMLAAYNAGPGAVAKHKGVPPYKETQNYVKNILHGTDPKPFYEGRIASNSKGVLRNNMDINNPNNASYPNPGVPVTSDQLYDLQDVANQLLRAGYSMEEIKQLLNSTQLYYEQQGANARQALNQQLAYMDTPIQIGTDQNTGQPIMSTPRQIQQQREQAIIDDDKFARDEMLNAINMNSVQNKNAMNSMYDRVKAANDVYQNRVADMYKGNYNVDPQLLAIGIDQDYYEGKISYGDMIARKAQLKYQADLANRNAMPYENYLQMQEKALTGDVNNQKAVQDLVQREIATRNEAGKNILSLYDKSAGVTKERLQNIRKDAELYNQLVTTLGPKVADTYTEMAKQYGTTLGNVVNYMQAVNTGAQTGAVGVINQNTQAGTSMRGQDIQSETAKDVANIQGDNAANVANIQGANALNLEATKQADPTNVMKGYYYQSQILNPYGMNPKGPQMVLDYMDPEARSQIFPGYQPGVSDARVVPPTVGHGQPTDDTIPTQNVSPTSAQGLRNRYNPQPRF